MLRKAARKSFYYLIGASPPALGARLSYLRVHGRWPRLDAPERFTEHVYAQKIRGDHRAFALLSDKVRVKEHVARVIGSSFVVPTLWHGARLPPREARDWPLPFVLKANHGSKMNALVRGPDDRDWDRLEAQAERWMARGWPASMLEEWYNAIDRQLLVEPLLDNGGKDLPDYKVFVFSGRAAFVQVDADRFGHHTRAFHGRDWEPLGLELAFPLPVEPPLQPRHLEAILDAAERLGRGFEFVRVDFYDLPDGPRFGEMTFAPGCGMQAFGPDGQDAAVGAMWREARKAAQAHDRAGATQQEGRGPKDGTFDPRPAA